MNIGNKNLNNRKRRHLTSVKKDVVTHKLGFWGAFKATLGFYAAQFTVTLVVLGSIGLMVAAYMLLTG